ncbi:YfhO family protein [Staphylococcus massiliensis]|uniref:YfhO family protein n=1 Tax=Staphylococcus massiliensis TaxID=555791 RepID=UPI001EE12A9A|nr:YfhO family protein [Staphylococcus massiliensis]MCG3411886.1 YfhO family protein [Staphylococcus massiliensis]
MKKLKQLLLYSIIFIAMSLIGHSYIIFRYVKDGILFTGPNDGIQQMVPIQMYLYNKWSEGTFFYSTDFGLGGDFFTDLSYYFTTNIIFITNFIVIKILNIFFHFDTSQMMFWMNNALITSIIKGALIMTATFLYVRHLRINKFASLLIAFLFASSPIYYRFTVYWPYFSDVYILLPLLFLSIERFLKKGKIGLFIIIVALSFINNFYFAYYQVLMGLIYFIFRLIMIHKHDIVNRTQRFIYLVIGSILGVGSSLFIFFHGARSFINNERVKFEAPLEFDPISRNTNIFFDNYLIVVIFISIQAILTFKLYKHFYYRLFAILTFILIICAFIPHVDSIFNGFSAPQKRWHYLLTFSSSILIGLYVHHFKSISWKVYTITSIPALLLLYISAYIYKDFVNWLYIVPIVFLIGLITLIMKSEHHKKWILLPYIASIFILGNVVSYTFIENNIFHPRHEDMANSYYINASKYNTPLQRKLVDRMDKETADDERIDWRVNEQDNTPMYQNFRGMSLYSSIFHHDIIDLFYDTLMINLKEESVSLYQSTGGRSNIASLFSTKYVMLKEYQDNLPDNFKKVHSDGQYRIYENQEMLPSVRVMDNYYKASSLKTPLDREHAMIDGVVMNDKGKPYKDKAKDLLDQTDISYHDIKRHDDRHIEVTKDNGGATIKLPPSMAEKYQDFYVTLYIKRGKPDSNFTLDVNGYENKRMFNNSKYKTGQYEQLYRVKPDENGEIHVGMKPTGNYEFKLLGLQGETYDKLKQADKEKRYTYKEENGKIDIQLKNHQKGMTVINIPYRKGMQAKVDGKKVDIEKVNYFMTGIPVDKDAKHIEITYKPPYFFLMICISTLFIVLSVFYHRFVSRKEWNRKEDKI